MKTKYQEDIHKWRQLIVGVTFIVLSALTWIIANNGVVASEDGFDPVRYEYLAREGLSVEDFLGANHNIVLLLQTIYIYLPAYWGYILFAGILMLGALNTSRGPVVRLMVFSPIAFYFFGQTSKDWLSILAIGMIVAWLTRRQEVIFYFWLFVTCAVAVFVRPQIIPIVIIVIILLKWGVKEAIFFSLIGSSIFLTYGEPTSYLEIHELTVQQEQSGELIKWFRELTFGYEWISILLRLTLYVSSVFYQPLLGFLKYFAGTDHSAYLLTELACIWYFVIMIYKEKVVKFVLVASVPFCILLAAVVPFYHFRYLLIFYPAVYVISIYWRDTQTMTRSQNSHENYS